MGHEQLHESKMIPFGPLITEADKFINQWNLKKSSTFQMQDFFVIKCKIFFVIKLITSDAKQIERFNEVKEKKSNQIGDCSPWHRNQFKERHEESCSSSAEIEVCSYTGSEKMSAYSNFKTNEIPKCSEEANLFFAAIAKLQKLFEQASINVV